MQVAIEVVVTIFSVLGTSIGQDFRIFLTMRLRRDRNSSYCSDPPTFQKDASEAHSAEQSCVAVPWAFYVHEAASGIQ